MWLLIAYWVVFIGYTITYWITGGPSAVVGWYKHISIPPFHVDAPLKWEKFLGGQVAILAITVALWFFGRRPTDLARNNTRKP